MNAFKHTDAGREATAKEIEAEREKMKENFCNLTPEVLDVYKKQARDHDARWEMATEGLKDLLNANNNLSYAALAEVCCTHE
jgi:hypothetical protein